MIRPRDLDGEPLLIISEYSITQRQILQSLEDVGIRQNIIMEATNSAPICDLISQKAGLSILEPVTARAFAGRGIVIRPYEPAIPLKMKFVHAANRPLSDRGRAFCALVQEEMETFRAEKL